jgi:peptide/nickel transport system permease protein
MRRYIIIRLFQAVITLFILSMVIFGLVRLHGDPAILMLDEGAGQEDYQNIRHQLGLDRPVYVQYWIFITNALQGDLGNSARTRRPVADSIKEAFPNSLKLALVSMFIGLILSLPLGVLAAVKKDTYLDTCVRVLAGLGQSVPTFWVGLIMIHIFVIVLGVMPSSGMATWKHYLMPAFCLGIFLMAGITRLLRSSMLEVLDSEFIRMARIKGVSERAVVWKHALRNSMLSVLSFGGMYIAILMTGAILIETVFAWPGFGRLAYGAIIDQDFPLIQGVVLTAGAAVMAANLVTDILYAYLDPRIRIRV